MVTPAARPLLVSLIVVLAGCGGSDSGGGGAPAQTWVTDPAPVVATAIPLVDTSMPDHVVGTGTAGSVTAAALQSAMNAGGVIAFDSGGANVTITLTSQLEVP